MKYTAELLKTVIKKSNYQIVIFIILFILFFALYSYSSYSSAKLVTDLKSSSSAILHNQDKILHNQDIILSNENDYISVRNKNHENLLSFEREVLVNQSNILQKLNK